MITSETFKKYLDFAYKVYQEKNISSQAYRQDGNVPYITHPLGAALLLLADTRIPLKERELGFKILLLHDVLEDTSVTLSDWIEPGVKKGVEEMTYTGPDSLKEKIEWIEAKNNFIKLLVLYDSFWSLYERHVNGSSERKEMWRKNILRLANEIEKIYGNIRIVQIAKAVVKNTSW
jgi:hypothetical protein